MRLKGSRRNVLWGALLASAIVAFAVFRSIELRSDLVDFLPAARTETARLMLQELRSGAATNLILIGLEGALPDDLARASQSMRDALSRSGQFSLVANGEASADPAAEQFLFDRRYLLSPATTPVIVASCADASRFRASTFTASAACPSSGSDSAELMYMAMIWGAV